VPEFLMEFILTKVGIGMAGKDGFPFLDQVEDRFHGNDKKIIANDTNLFLLEFLTNMLTYVNITNKR